MLAAAALVCAASCDDPDRRLTGPLACCDCPSEVSLDDAHPCLPPPPDTPSCTCSARAKASGCGPAIRFTTSRCRRPGGCCRAARACGQSGAFFCNSARLPWLAGALVLSQAVMHLVERCLVRHAAQRAFVVCRDPRHGAADPFRLRRALRATGRRPEASRGPPPPLRESGIAAAPHRCSGYIRERRTGSGRKCAACGRFRDESASGPQAD